MATDCDREEMWRTAEDLAQAQLRRRDLKDQFDCEGSGSLLSRPPNGDRVACPKHDRTQPDRFDVRLHAS